MNASPVHIISEVSRYEIRKAIAAHRWILTALLAAFPLLPLLIISLSPALIARLTGPTPEILDAMYARIFMSYSLRLGIFFATVAVFAQLYRRELQERTLHAWLLLPVDGSQIILGKYLAGCALVAAAFMASTVTGYLLLFLPGGGRAVLDHLLTGGAAHLATYLGLILMATASYGALFLYVGTLRRSPVLPVLGVFLFEWVNAFLPGLLQQLSIAHTLAGLLPVEPIGFTTPGPSGWGELAVTLVLTLALLVLSVGAMRRAQISYSD